ncbi:unnamed protein product [Oppiella nova]|uniref:AMP-dependent synthetase/ligase domain-containing protein n=1 Tax=Oppiella nova TaxID=334625 RepID=A0A7R9LVJ8_9ACAR|nr:unnamed protein product [Oppiella nova]CAG2167079.1 unnamed protein product [Oppiella nova]
MGKDNILRSKRPVIESEFKTVGAYIWDKLQKLDSNAVCLTEALSGKQLTIGELKSRANAVAVALVDRGVTKGDRIAFYGQNSIQHAVLRFAVKFLGLTFMPLSPTFEKYEVRQEFTAAGANIIVSSADDFHKFQWVLDDSQNNNINGVKLVVIFDGKRDKHVTYDQLVAEGTGRTLPQIPYFEVNPDIDMLFLIHTSGSTGRPKCAMIPHRTFIAGSQESLTFLNYEMSEQVVLAMQYPCGHISGTVMIPMQVINGFRLVIFGEFSEELLMKSIEKYRINVLPAFPAFGRRLIDPLEQLFMLESSDFPYSWPPRRKGPL